MTDATGSVAWDADYAPFGSASVKPLPAVVNHLRFPGQYYSPALGLHYNYFRDYDPRTGRYVESDPIGQRGSVDGFIYTLNNPVNRTDPRGLQDEGTIVRGGRAMLEGACRNSLATDSCCAPGSEPEACDARVTECMLARGLEVGAATGDMLSAMEPGLPGPPISKARPGQESAERILDLLKSHLQDAIDTGAELVSGSDDR
jgi:RHS repeat-associated protein